jgi:hypothetical protein
MPFRSSQSPRPESNPALTRNPGGLDDFWDQLACAWREIDAESTMIAVSIRAKPRGQWISDFTA